MNPWDVWMALDADGWLVFAALTGQSFGNFPPIDAPIDEGGAK